MHHYLSLPTRVVRAIRPDMMRVSGDTITGPFWALGDESAS